MVTKKQTSNDKAGKKNRVRIGKLKLNKETVKDLTSDEAQRVKGGLSEACYDGVRAATAVTCVGFTSADNCN